MVSRVVLAALLVGTPAAASAVQPVALLPVPADGPLPYDLTGFVVEPARETPVPQVLHGPLPKPAPPQIAARAPLDYRVDSALYDRTPDHLALRYDLSGFLPPIRRDPAYGPLEYELGGLLGAGSP